MGNIKVMFFFMIAQGNESPEKTKNFIDPSLRGLAFRRTWMIWTFG